MTPVPVSITVAPAPSAELLAEVPTFTPPDTPVARVHPKERANSPDGLHSAIILRDELDLKGKLRDERVVIRTENGSAPDRQVYAAESGIWGLKWSPEGKWLAIHHRADDQTGELFVVDSVTGTIVDAGADARNALGIRLGFAHGLYFSPDGRSLLVAVYPAPANAHGTPSSATNPGSLFIVDTSTGAVRKRIEWE